MAYLALVRHGESEWNASNIWTGWTDISLTEKGRQEAREIGQKLKDIIWQVAFVSDLARSRQTYDEIAKVLNLKIPVIADPALKERDYGDLTALNKDEVKKEYGQQQFDLWHRSWEVAPPKGESLKDVYARVIPYYHEQILPHLKKGENVLVCAHGNSIRALIKFLDHVSDQDISSVELATGQAIIYQIDSDGKVIKKEIKDAYSEPLHQIEKLVV